ncbi:MAG: hypothetical protein NUV34_00975 [Sulfuricaulis sp.]|nr:hypothetical protein [Sulfuricaulis sp.]
MVNYEKLLKKYMAHVLQVEGCDFLWAVQTSKKGRHPTEIIFTKEEAAALNKLAPIREDEE